MVSLTGNNKQSSRMEQEEGAVSRNGRHVEFKTKNADGTTKTVTFTAKKKDRKQRVYADNAKNRAAGRVGEPIPMTPAMVEWATKVRLGQVQRDEKGRILKSA